MEFEIFRAKLQGAIDACEINEEFSLQDLFGGNWPDLPPGTRVNELGEWFKQHVRGSESFTDQQPFNGIEFSRKKSNNLSVYKRVAA